MNRPRLLDAYCCEGGATAGYQAAGFHVTGIDLDARPAYPGDDFIQTDAVTYIREHGHEYDAIHASPPCQAYSLATPAHRRDEWPDLIAPTRAALIHAGRPWVLENVEGARRHLDHAIRLCGSSFGLQVRRHRWFESSELLMPLPCRHAEQGPPIGVYGQHGDLNGPVTRPDGGSRGTKARDLHEARTAMGMPWATWRGCVEAIPPKMTEWIGWQLLEALSETAA